MVGEEGADLGFEELGAGVVGGCEGGEEGGDEEDEGQGAHVVCMISRGGVGC